MKYLPEVSTLKNKYYGFRRRKHLRPEIIAALENYFEEILLSTEDSITTFISLIKLLFFFQTLFFLCELDFYFEEVSLFLVLKIKKDNLFSFYIFVRILFLNTEVRSTLFT